MALSLMKKIKIQYIPKDQIVFRENENDDDGRFYVLLHGKASVEKVSEMNIQNEYNV